MVCGRPVEYFRYSGSRSEVEWGLGWDGVGAGGAAGGGVGFSLVDLSLFSFFFSGGRERVEGGGQAAPRRYLAPQVYPSPSSSHRPCSHSKQADTAPSRIRKRRRILASEEQWQREASNNHPLDERVLVEKERKKGGIPKVHQRHGPISLLFRLPPQLAVKPAHPSLSPRPTTSWTSAGP